MNMNLKINIRFFASLRERYPQAREELEVTAPVTVADVWQQATGEKALPDNILCAFNMEYVDPRTVIQEDGEVAFFPPVTGG